MRGGDEDQEELEEDQGSLRQPRHRDTQPHLEIDLGAFIECLAHTMDRGSRVWGLGSGGVNESINLCGRTQ